MVLKRTPVPSKALNTEPCRRITLLTSLLKNLVLEDTFLNVQLTNKFLPFYTSNTIQIFRILIGYDWFNTVLRSRLCFGTEEAAYPPHTIIKYKWKTANWKTLHWLTKGTIIWYLSNKAMWKYRFWMWYSFVCLQLTHPFHIRI